MSKSIEERLRAVEDYLEIQNLKARYLNAADGGWDRLSHNVEGIVDCFTEDGWWESSLHGRAEGHAGLRSYFKEFQNELPFAYHTITNPRIEVNGDEATAEWHMTWTGTDKTGQEHIAGAMYDDKLLRTATGWKFQSVYVKVIYMGPKEKGWAQLMKELQSA